MRYQIFLLVTLVVSLSTGLFSLAHINRFLAQEDTIVGSWNNENSEVVFDNDTAVDSSRAQVLGASTASQSLKPTYTLQSFQGYLFDQYLALHHSPLYGYGEEFVKACKKYGAPADCTLLLAIAKVETDLCKTDISAKQFNCWGWGGSGPNRILFNSFPEAIDTITGRLKANYGERFFLNPNNGALRYCGAHCTSWGRHVQSERERINNFFKTNGHPGLF